MEHNGGVLSENIIVRNGINRSRLQELFNATRKEIQGVYKLSEYIAKPYFHKY
jgi:hypothetical protein